MPALPQQEGKGQHKTQTNMSVNLMHCIGIDQLKKSSK